MRKINWGCKKGKILRFTISQEWTIVEIDLEMMNIIMTAPFWSKSTQHEH